MFPVPAVTRTTTPPAVLSTAQVSGASTKTVWPDNGRSAGGGRLRRDQVAFRRKGPTVGEPSLTSPSRATTSERWSESDKGAELTLGDILDGNSDEQSMLERVELAESRMKLLHPPQASYYRRAPPPKKGIIVVVHWHRG